MADVKIGLFDTHNSLLNVVGIRIRSSQVAKYGLAEILELLFWTGTFKILAKTLHEAHQPLLGSKVII